MKLNSLTVSYADVTRLLSAIAELDVTPPRALTEVVAAHEKLTAALSSVVTNPVKMLVTAALDGHAGAEKVDRLLERAALARLVAEERRGLDQRVEPALVEELGRRLDAGAADEVLDLIRPRFDAAAATLQSAQAIGIPDDMAAFIETASPDQLRAWQSVKPAVTALNTVAAVASAFGPTGPFPVVTDPRTVSPIISCGWLHSVGVMCCSSDLQASCAAFQRPNPLDDVRSSPWLRVTPHLHSVDSAAERVRLWAERAWADEVSQRPRGGRLVGGEVVRDPMPKNPFTLEEVSV
jgi:hypothetical protein